MQVTKNFRTRRELQVGFGHGMGPVSLICFRAATSPYDVFVQSRNCVSLLGRHICAWPGEQSMGWISAYTHQL